MNHSKPIPNPIEALQTSLQMEFEHFAQYDWSADLLAAKKRQLELLKHIMAPTHTVIKAKTADRPVLKWSYVDGKLTPDRKLRSTMPSVKEMLEGLE